ncbi:hypothetical protein Q8A64_17175 [Oxalobacteraceae bacterium R-40]|uniref:Uncharacterized protein n=1 Tax=Keguizhuia sedimenti TaxID=3064264 RepID=A0ABU1BT54_9BURK|nr:hypothetical protein [Oxalobacteraceae bacterium R-40]
MSTTHHHLLPSTPQLIKASVIAMSVASVILVTAVLPAEYGIDPTGLGKSMGLTALSMPNTQETTNSKAPAANSLQTLTTPSPAPNGKYFPAVLKTQMPLRNDELSLTLQPNEGAEIKAQMRQGDQFVFSWTAQGGPVNFDMHGEPPNAGDDFTSYWKGKQQE